VATWRELQQARRAGSLAAQRARRRLGIPLERRVDIFAVVEADGIWLMFQPLRELYGFYRRFGEVAGIAHNASIGGNRWLRKVFTDGERHYADGDAERLATRFAAKEAVAKALGTGFRDGISPTAIEIVCDTAGTPTVVLHGAAATAAGALGVGRVRVSLTRDGGIAAAAAWALAND
jgi:holo-[acyl-carrier protein] synthase